MLGSWLYVIQIFDELINLLGDNRQLKQEEHIHEMIANISVLLLSHVVILQY